MPYTISDGSKTASSVAIYTISPVISGGVHNGPTITHPYNSTNYTVPAFMKGFEQDPTWTGSGVRFRCREVSGQFLLGAVQQQQLGRLLRRRDRLSRHKTDWLWSDRHRGDPHRARKSSPTPGRELQAGRKTLALVVPSDPNTFQRPARKLALGTIRTI